MAKISRIVQFNTHIPPLLRNQLISNVIKSTNSKLTINNETYSMSFNNTIPNVDKLNAEKLMQEFQTFIKNNITEFYSDDVVYIPGRNLTVKLKIEFEKEFTINIKHDE